MAKQLLPSVDDVPTVKQSQVQQRAEPVAAAAAIVEGYMARRVDVKLPLKHRMILHKKLRKLQDSGAKLQDGTEVSDKTKAVLWILENEVE